jgi:hypothetical protein
VIATLVGAGVRVGRAVGTAGAGVGCGTGVGGRAVGCPAVATGGTAVDGTAVAVAADETLDGGVTSEVGARAAGWRIVSRSSQPSATPAISVSIIRGRLVFR